MEIQITELDIHSLYILSSVNDQLNSISLTVVYKSTKLNLLNDIFINIFFSMKNGYFPVKNSHLKLCEIGKLIPNSMFKLFV